MSRVYLRYTPVPEGPYLRDLRDAPRSLRDPWRIEGDAAGEDGSAEFTVSQEKQQQEDKFCGKMLLKWSHKTGEQKIEQGIRATRAHTHRNETKDI